MAREQTITGYMCTIDWDWEIGHASDGSKVYPSVEALKREHECWETCGIVEVSVTLKQVIAEEQEPEWDAEGPNGDPA